ncbi:unnamed protein product [Phytophthora fragariaefolia]|uniref:Unnamed protein product n=1 Tax=Phytophthora fragariaefolia TaxID=1490495 RepID=A0A9W6XL87_9STRA|nr:unnamed protein product [Phytophthora fragariaefolia]
MSLGEYKKVHGNTVFARDELEALFDVGSDADMEDGEEDEEISSSRRDYPSVGSRRPRGDDSDASSLKRSRSGSDRPLADTGPLSSPRGGGDSTPSGVVASRTGAVRDPWMPSPSEIQSRFGSTAPPSQYALYSCGGIKDDDVTKELDFDPATDQRRDYYIGLFHEPRSPTNTKIIWTLGSDDQLFAGRSSKLPPVRLEVGGGGGVKTTRVWPARLTDRLEAVERP